ncbi:MAG: PAS domain-containing protein, partial [Gammaproteobacteria bacterium]|nr:PAS domain-containing protein [Gammaproteobacteria bacterium]
MSVSAKRIRQLLSWLGDRDRQLQLALDAAELGTWNWDPATNELVWSERCRSLLGVAADAPATVENFLQLVHPEDRAAVGQAIETALQVRDSYSIEYRIVRPDGQMRWLHSLGRAHQTDPRGNAFGMSGIVRDVTAAHRATESAQRQEQYLAQLLGAAPVCVAKLDRELRVIAANAPFRENLRLGAAELAGRRLHELLPELPGTWRGRLRLGLAGQAVRFGEECLPRADGSLDWLKGQIVPWLDEHGAVGGIVLMFDVLTSQRRAEAQLRRQDEQQRLDQRYRLLVERLPLGVMLTDQDGAVSYFNPAWRALAAPGQADIMGLDQAEVVHPQDRARVRAGWQRLAQDPSTELEFRLHPRGTEERWVRCVSSALRDVNGVILGHAHACIDITSHR